MANNPYDKATLLRELNKAYRVFSEPFSRAQFDEISEVSSRTMERFFGSWTKALEAAGLDKKFEEFKKVEDERKSFSPEKELKEHWNQRKADLIKRAESRKIQLLKESAHKLDMVKDMLEETLAKADPPIVEVRPLKFHKKDVNGRHCVLWFEFSDLQLGTLMTSEEMGGLNKHNWVIWQKKLDVWEKQVIEKIAEHLESGFIVDNVVLACLGDMVEGQDIFKGQVWQIDRHVVDQAIFGANDTAKTFLKIAMTFPQLNFHILEVFGNHGRVQRKGEAPYSCSMDKIYQRMVQMQIDRVRECSNVTYHVNEAWFYLVEIYGWNHLLLHGNQGMSSLWSNRPTVNGLEKGITRYNQMLQQQIHFVHAGHFHNSWQLSFNMSQVLINGSFIGTSNFSATQMVASSPPTQNLHRFEPRVGLACTEQIYLTEGDVRVAIEPRRLKKES